MEYGRPQHVSGIATMIARVMKVCLSVLFNATISYSMCGVGGAGAVGFPDGDLLK